MMKILVIGQSGQLSQEFQQQSLRNAHGYKWLFLGRNRCDLSQPQQIIDCVEQFQPNIIINAAAYTAVDLAETQVSDAFAVNTTGVMHLALAAEKIGAFLIHYSTDYVFDGKSELPYQEHWATQPLNVYGASKRAGELALLAACPNSVILRASWVTSIYGGNFTKTMIKLLQERESLSIVSDQWGTPTSTELLWTVTLRLIQAYQDKAPLNTIYHVTEAGLTQWADYAAWVKTILQRQTPNIRLADIQPIPSHAYPVKAKRPQHSWLDTSTIQQALSYTFQPWQEAVEKIVVRLLK